MGFCQILCKKRQKPAKNIEDFAKFPTKIRADFSDKTFVNIRKR